jgi:hypothetical protein
MFQSGEIILQKIICVEFEDAEKNSVRCPDEATAKK